MADRSIAAGDTLNKLRFEFNGTAEDIGDISGITALNTDLTTSQLTIIFLVVDLSFLRVQLTMVLKQL